MQLWESILQTDCPEEMVSQWHKNIREIVSERVTGVVSANYILAIYIVVT